MVGRAGFEPAANALKGHCSTNWATDPSKHDGRKNIEKDRAFHSMTPRASSRRSTELSTHKEAEDDYREKNEAEIFLLSTEQSIDIK